VHFSTYYNPDLTLHVGRRPQKKMMTEKQYMMTEERWVAVGKQVIPPTSIGLQAILSKYVLEHNLVYIRIYQISKTLETSNL